MSKSTLSVHAQAAKQVRAHLKAQGIKGTVKASKAAGTSSLRISLANGSPSVVEAVTEFANQYQYGNFDGMTDSYYYDNVTELPQVRFVFVEADFDNDIKQKALDALSKEFGLPAMTVDNVPYSASICGEEKNVYSAMRATLTGCHYPHVPLWEELTA